VDKLAKTMEIFNAGLLLTESQKPSNEQKRLR
jgi:hypothetical protein